MKILGRFVRNIVECTDATGRRFVDPRHPERGCLMVSTLKTFLNPGEDRTHDLQMARVVIMRPDLLPTILPRQVA